MVRIKRKMPVGAEVLPEEGVHFRVWSTFRTSVEVVLYEEGERVVSLAAEGDGYFSGICTRARSGSLYRFRLDGGESFPDPASRFQPDGPHGPSQVVDPCYSWGDPGWKGVSREGQVIYEMHVGTFTPEGTWKAAAAQLSALAELGITVVELMPVAEFPGRFGWGYDGVCLFAPFHHYGNPDDFRGFVDHAHAVGLGVILDVVYNHFGPEGNYLLQYSPEYLTERNRTEWGAAVNLDGPQSQAVRDFFLANSLHWISEYHLDGLRFDATQQTFDSSPRHIFACITEESRRAAGDRELFFVGENEPQRVVLLRSPDDGGYGIDAVWNDDFHHAARVAATGASEAYYSEYRGSPQELISAVKWSFLYQGQYYFWQGKRRGTPTAGLPPYRFVNFLQNHDQIANSCWGRRLHQLTAPGSFRAITALLLLAPATPMLFQGQEFAASTPFLYFTDLGGEIVEAVRRGRYEFLGQFPNVRAPEVRDRLPDPCSPHTFAACRLDISERESHRPVLELHRDLLRLRRTDPVFSRADGITIEGAVLGSEAFLLRFCAGTTQRLLLVNLGADLRLAPAPEPLLAPPEGMGWKLLWSSEHPDYGGSGTPDLETDRFWRVQGHATVVLEPVTEVSI